MAYSECKFKKILIANRGEIAIRIAKSVRALGIECHAVYSAADREALHVRSADFAHFIGGKQVDGSYLDQAAILKIARKHSVDAIHPGYGFLSENPEFARRVKKAGICFIGPSSQAIERLGNKTNAKQLARRLKIPVLEAFKVAPSLATKGPAFKRFIEENPLPLVIKAAAGGGGRGMRIIRKLSELEAALKSAAREAAAAFNDSSLFIERYLEDVRHIEVQIVADHYGDTRHLFDRDCTIQRNHQKLIEEAPALLSDKLRSRMFSAAERICRAARYTNLGTVEFLVTKDDKFYFLEVNSRLQVEHPVSEEITGLDFVELQIAVASGQKLKSLLPRRLTARGHAIQCRICAESPERGFIANTGVIAELSAEGAQRLDAGFEKGDRVSALYDSLLAKLIVRGDSRAEAVAAAQQALKKFKLFGVVNNTALLRNILHNSRYIQQKTDTRFIEEILSKVSWQKEFSVAAAVFTQAVLCRAWKGDIWNEGSGWRVLGRSNNVSRDYLINDSVEISSRISVLDKHNFRISDQRAARDLRGIEYELQFDRGSAWLHFEGRSLKITDITSETAVGSGAKSGESTQSGKNIKSPLPGKVVEVWASPGKRYDKGSRLIAVESMKMEHIISAESNLKVKEVLIKAGDLIKGDEVLVIIE